MFKKIYEMIRQQLKQGLTPHGLALSISVGATLALFPIIGTTTALCLLAGTALGLNQPIMQLLNYSLYPLHLALIPAFIYFGETIFGVEHNALNLTAMTEEFRTSLSLFFAHFGLVILHAIVAWILTAPFMGAAIYFITRWLVGKKLAAGRA